MHPGDEREAAIARHLEGGCLREAATQALHGYGGEILGYLGAVLHDDDAAAEVFARFAEDVWTGLGGFQRRCSFRTWAYRLAFSRARDFRREAFRRRGRRLETREHSQLAKSRTESESWRDEAGRDRLESLRRRLRPTEQTLLILRVDRGLSWREVACVLSLDAGRPISEGALRKRFEALTRKLRGLARREGLLS
jgi:RNA polymerase sigma-70 factor (ECF subfamily)